MKIGTLYNQSNETSIGDRIGCADSSHTRLIGLLGRRSLNAGEGIWIRPSSGVHTFAMLFSIDAVGLDHKMKIVRLWPNLRPWRIPMPSLQVKSVVELRAGEIRARALHLGHTLSYIPSL